MDLSCSYDLELIDLRRFPRYLNCLELDGEVMFKSCIFISVEINFVKCV